MEHDQLAKKGRAIMVSKLYVSNLSPTATGDQLCDLFKDIGTIETIQFIEQAAGSDWPRSAEIDIDIQSDDWERINGIDLDGRRLAVSRATPDPAQCQPTDETQQVAQYITEQLNEPANALKRIERVVRFGGIPFSQTILEEALAIEEQGGMLTQDQSRKRTPGGVFFYLVRGRISKVVRKQIFYTRPKRPKDKPPAAAPKPARKKNAQQVPAPASRPRPTMPLPEAQEQLTELRQKLAAAQSRLDQLKATNTDQKTGLFSSIKIVLDLQKQINTLLKDYPELDMP